MFKVGDNIIMRKNRGSVVFPDGSEAIVIRSKYKKDGETVIDIKFTEGNGAVHKGERVWGIGVHRFERCQPCKCRGAVSCKRHRVVEFRR